MGLTRAQRTAFAERGFLRLPGALSQAAVQRIAARIWEHLTAEHDVHVGDPATWTIAQPTGFQRLAAEGVFAPIAAGPVIAALDELLGTNQWHSTERWGAPLVTFPATDARWDVPERQWHLDFLARGASDELCGVRLIALVGDVAPRAGGTVVASGSHRLVAGLVETGRAGDGHSARVRDALAAHPWFRALWSRAADTQARIERFMIQGADIDGVGVRVEELTGSAGDVILLHPWMFHAPARHCGRKPRFAISHSVFRAGVPE